MPCSAPSAPRWRVFYGLRIRHVGEATAKDLARHFGQLDALMAASVEQLLQVNDAGPIVAQAICDFFAEAHNREVQQLREVGVVGMRPSPHRRRRWPGRRCSRAPCPRRTRAGAGAAGGGGRQAGSVSNQLRHRGQ